MAKSGKTAFNYNAEVRLLKERGPERLYLLYGPEEYLRERFLDALLERCVPEANEFSLRRFNGPAVDLNALSEAVDALPFFTERTFVLVRDYDLNRCRDAEWERLKGILSDIPETCTAAFVQTAVSEPDGRLAAVKGLKKLGRAIEFTEQDAPALIRWICGRFRALGKTADRETAERLIFLSGARMLDLIPEIEKAAAYARGEAVTPADVDATANRVPEAVVWDMTDDLAAGRYDAAASALADLLSDKDNHPILLTALIGQQLRRMYACKAGQEAGVTSRAELMELTGIRFDAALRKLETAVRPWSAPRLGKLVSLCAEYDYRMKSTGTDPYVLIRELFARVAAEKR